MDEGAEDLILVLGMRCACRYVSADQIAKQVDPLASAPTGFKTSRRMAKHAFGCSQCKGDAYLIWEEIKE